LSNEFSLWMLRTKAIQVAQERKFIDATFHKGSRTYLVEFKIAYLGNTRRAIREALGQILEYNFYPPRTKQDRWLLVLNKEPSEDDRQFLITTVVDNDNLKSLWDTTLRRELWRHDYRVGSRSCFGRMA
jgi:hypothetical protein